jgi:hypothetical protein
MQRNYRSQHLNFRKDTTVQIKPDGHWKDYTVPCTMKLAVELALRAERIYGMQNVRLSKIGE